jgi:hypothetical protein
MDVKRLKKEILALPHEEKRERSLQQHVWTGGAMDIEVLGRGCHECDETARNAERAVRDLRRDVVVVQRWRMADMARYDYPPSPALVIDGRLICSGRTMGVREIKRWLLQGPDAACAA